MIIFFAPLVALPLYAMTNGQASRPNEPQPSATVPPPIRSRPATAMIARPASPAPAAAVSPAPEPSALVVKRILDTGGPIRYGEFFWDEAGAPAGPLVITVDLAAETISAFRDGYEIGTAAIIFGGEGKGTPLGTFPITQKDATHVSNLYHAPMPYMLRLTDDGVSIHGSKIAYDYATHGCVGVPMGFAKKLFGVARLGDRVIITRGKTLDIGQPITTQAT